MSLLKPIRSLNFGLKIKLRGLFDDPIGKNAKYFNKGAFGGSFLSKRCRSALKNDTFFDEKALLTGLLKVR